MSSRAEELRARVTALDPERREQLIARVRREQEARRTLWLCHNPKCNGDPHPDAPVRHARASQRMPFRAKDGKIGAFWMAGRGFGKTRVGAEGVRQLVSVEQTHSRVTLIGRTGADVRDVMIEGESGLLACYPRWDRPEYQPSKRRILFRNGAVATLFSADKPDQLRGPQSDLIWGDEVSTWAKMLCVSTDTGKPTAEGALTNALLGLRLGNNPRCVLTGTPKPTRDLKYLVKDSRFYLIRGKTYDNLGNLADVFRDIVIGAYEGTRAGRQELDGELLEDVEGALLSQDDFEWDGFRAFEPKDIAAITVAVDPAVTSNAKSDHTGITVMGLGYDASRRTVGVVLYSQRFKGTPEAVRVRVEQLVTEYGARSVVAEVNNGGEYIRSVLRQGSLQVPVEMVKAAEGKYARADPVAMLYQQHRMRHLGDPSLHAALETEWTHWTPLDDESPDVLDSDVWAATHLLLRDQPRGRGKARSVRQ